MSRIDTSRTVHHAPFAGRERRFQLRLAEICELERLAGAGIGEVALRLSAHTFRLADVRETIRLGLMGGGASEPEATALVIGNFDGRPLADYLPLAGEIVRAALSGVEPDEGKAEAESRDGPATSPPSFAPAA